MGDLNLNSGYGYKLKQILKFQSHLSLATQVPLEGISPGTIMAMLMLSIF